MSAQTVDLPHKAMPATNLSPNYSYVFLFEEEFDNVKIRPYVEEYWKIVVLCSLGEKTHLAKQMISRGGNAIQ